MKTTIKQIIVSLGCRGFITPAIAHRLIRVGGLAHE